MSYRREINQNRRIKNIEKKMHQEQFQEEVKYTDLYSNYATLAPNTAIQILTSLMPAGLNQQQRIGSQVRATSLVLRINFRTLTSALTGGVVRMMVLWDQQTNGAFFTTVGDPIAGTAALLNTNPITDPSLAPRQLETIQRFHVIHDKLYNINPGANLTATTTVPSVRSINKRFKFNRIIRFDDAVSLGVQALVTNSLYVLLVSPGNASGTPVATVEYQIATRLYFKDD